jgi:hypothetical protein
MINIDEKFERKQNILLVGTGVDKYLNELKANLSDIDFVECSDQTKLGWNQELDSRAKLPENIRKNKIILIKNIQDFKTSTDTEIIGFLMGSKRWKCWWWIITDSLTKNKIDEEILFNIYGSIDKVIIGDVSLEDEKLLREHGMFKDEI